MQDTALNQYLLCLQSPWTVSRVNLDVNTHGVEVWAAHLEDAACPIGVSMRIDLLCHPQPVEIACSILLPLRNRRQPRRLDKAEIKIRNPLRDADV